MNIHPKLIAPIITLSISLCLTAAPARAQGEPPPKSKHSSELTPERQKELMRNVKPLPSGTNFTIEPIPGPFVQYTILVTDAENRTVSGNFVRPQLDIFEALLLAARQFALTEEEAGTKSQPKVTRFMDKNEKGLFIDVQKAGAVSRFYVTLHSLYGKMTIDAGSIVRGNTSREKEQPEPLFDKIITRLQAAKNTNPMPTQIQQ